MRGPNNFEFVWRCVASYVVRYANEIDVGYSFMSFFMNLFVQVKGFFMG